MKTAHSKLPAMLLVAAVISAIGVPVFAGQIHPVCAPKQHDCGKAPTLTNCCCGDQSEASNQAGPAERRVQVHPSLTFAPALVVTTDFQSLHRTIARPHTSPPRAGPLDLPTLLTTLLI